MKIPKKDRVGASLPSSSWAPDFSMRIGAASSRPSGVFPLGIWGWNNDGRDNLKVPEGVGEGAGAG